MSSHFNWVNWEEKKLKSNFWLVRFYLFLLLFSFAILFSLKLMYENNFKVKQNLKVISKGLEGLSLGFGYVSYLLIC